MATVRWHLDELSGSTLTLRLYPRTSGSIANGAGGDPMTESGDGLFSATVAESLSGWHAAYADRSGVPVAKGWVDMDAAGPTVVESIAAATASEGGTSVVQPYSAHAPQRVNGTKLTAFLNEHSDVSIVVTCYDAEGDLLDLTGLELTAIVASDSDPDTPLATPQTFTGSGSTFSLTLNTAFTSAVALAGQAHHWSLRDGTEVIQRGRLEVLKTASASP